ncbi:GntR family transcriptional regulator [Pseudarthrobacter phenanthrenivorans]|uniref:GntR family transcriptional regulator n=2 Tax=Pseudarthrobacter phenanthrenivorans TaxID=361575 RepID=A0A3B0FPK1_PSEPS|nr:GntR family transcriptional regulator [Pseudarthrobacter phenanthrenivorans]ADX71346.1 transcriptional regulator [Pseudarthrobacter phenanthrenivorans Sphe3]RKO23501.1 GntR family transcriptional regulator [Pseudarthrobacter phenanthrenivorans]
MSEGTVREVEGRGRSGVDVYAILRAKILDLQLPPDGKVNIDALAREIGVSQTPIREALSQLEGDRLIVKTPGKGYRTTALLDTGELRELFEFRLLVEPWAARAAAVNRLINPAHALQAWVDEFEAGTAQEGSVRHRLVTHDTAFHDRILSASSNEFALHAYRATHCHLHLFRLHPADYQGTTTVEEHRAIVNAIAACDPDAAEEAMHRHLIGAYHRFAEAFDQDDAGLRIPSPAKLC